MLSFSMILAVDERWWIWRSGDLAWKLKDDMKYFKELTTYNKDLSLLNAVIMWKNTWESLPAKYRPLPDRINCILSKSIKKESKNSKANDFVLYFNDFDHCLRELSEKDNVWKVFVIWWAQVYNSSLNHEFLDKIYLTKLVWDYSCDVFFDWIPDNFELEAETDEKEQNDIKFKFQIWKKKY